MNNDGMKIVYFDQYCKTCEHKKRGEDEQPCRECLSEPTNVDSHKPVKWVERSKK